MKHFLLFVAAASAWAQPALAPPQLGFIADSAHSLRPVFGVAGSFVLGSAAATGVTSAAFSGSLGLLKTDSAVVAFDPQGNTLASIGAAAGPALFGFAEKGDAALAYLPNSGEIIRFSGGRFTPRSVTVDASFVISVAFPNLRQASLIIQRDGGLWELRVGLADGSVDSQTALTGFAAPVLELPSQQLVASDTQGIVVRNPDGSERHIAARLPANFALLEMSNGWVQVVDLGSAARFAVRVTPGHEGFYMLPGVRP